MRTQNFSSIRRAAALLVLPCMVLLLFPAPSRTQEKIASEGGISNIKWTTKGDIIKVNYDLYGAADRQYIVDIVMKREGDAAFAAIPHAVEGDIGEGFFAGTNREIRWFFRRDYPDGLQGEGYYFEIHVKLESKQSTWLYYAVGAAAVTGGVIALLVSRNQDRTVPVIELPFPPSRP